MALPDSVASLADTRPFPPDDVPQGRDDLQYEPINLPLGVKGITLKANQTDGNINSPGVEVVEVRNSPGMKTSVAKDRGLQAGMIITHVNGVTVVGKNFNQVSEWMKDEVRLSFHNPHVRSGGGGRKKKTAHKKTRTKKRRTKKRRTKKRRTKKRRNTKRRASKRL
jgi:hypothetical protein